MNVDEFVIAASTSRDLPSLGDILRVLSEYVDMLEKAGFNPIEDPAVLLLGSYVAFHTHSDINTVGGYNRLLAACLARAEADKAPRDPH